MRQGSEVRALLERIGFLETEIERLQEAEHALRGQLASCLPTTWFHDALDQRGVPRDQDGRRLTLTERLDWLGQKRGT